mmetsp:Transcript_7686/g.22575  ORF Transcript_7686/g.22575 Transcript_7686/m.22575 type:complete len:216 (+) Transcript_7686:165-812(+)
MRAFRTRPAWNLGGRAYQGRPSSSLVRRRLPRLRRRRRGRRRWPGSFRCSWRRPNREARQIGMHDEALRGVRGADRRLGVVDGFPHERRHRRLVVLLVVFPALPCRRRWLRSPHRRPALRRTSAGSSPRASSSSSVRRSPTALAPRRPSVRRFHSGGRHSLDPSPPAISWNRRGCAIRTRRLGRTPSVCRTATPGSSRCRSPPSRATDQTGARPP